MKEKVDFRSRCATPGDYTPEAEINQSTISEEVVYKATIF
ncbi:hypothetical protein BSG1_17825 [Bacillus sp. SG-1]|nr:hypothetical protein BSG1_17825 [Bacillus sp. SG-1]